MKSAQVDVGKMMDSGEARRWMAGRLNVGLTLVRSTGTLRKKDVERRVDVVTLMGAGRVERDMSSTRVRQGDRELLGAEDEWAQARAADGVDVGGRVTRLDELAN